MKNLHSGDALKYLDASVPLCVFLGEPEERLEACRQIIKKIEIGKERVRTSVFTIAEIAHVLMKRERERPARIEEMIKNFLDCVGLRVSDARKDLCLPALEVALKYKIDFVDAHHILTMRQYNIKEIYSLDPHYDRFTGIRRLEKSAR